MSIGQLWFTNSTTDCGVRANFLYWHLVAVSDGGIHPAPVVFSDEA
jgi:hypothetical protein